MLGITSVDGNAFVEDVVTNILITEAVCGEKYPVFAGASCSMMGENKKDYYFQEDGLGMKQKEYL